MNLSEALASVLRSGRDEFNARFAEARRAHPDLQASVFSEFLISTVDPLARAVERVRPDGVADVVNAAYDVGLELVGQKLAGSGARENVIDEGWRRVLTPIGSLLASSPRSLLGAVSNALLNLVATPGARPATWIETLERLGSRCGDSQTFLRLGQVAAWRCGLAHFRESALAAAALLPGPLALEVLGASPTTNWPELQAALAMDPWLNPAQAGNDPSAKKELRVVSQAGGFSGFGGLFAEPPRVAAAGPHFLVRSGDGCWLLTADLFGATFHRAAREEFEAASRQNRTGPQVRNGRVNWQGAELPGLADAISAAANATTLAVTSRLSHAVTLAARLPWGAART